MCTEYQDGRCVKGRACKYSHSLFDVKRVLHLQHALSDDGASGAFVQMEYTAEGAGRRWNMHGGVLSVLSCVNASHVEFALGFKLLEAAAITNLQSTVS